jgi:hypothetical protein
MIRHLLIVLSIASILGACDRSPRETLMCKGYLATEDGSLIVTEKGQPICVE